MILNRTEWAMRFATAFLDLRDGGVELAVLRRWGEELYARQGHLDPADEARRQFAAGQAPAIAAGEPASEAAVQSPPEGPSGNYR